MKKWRLTSLNEESTLQAFFEIINKTTKSVRYIHYNGMGFDIPFLIVRTAHYGIQINNWNFVSQGR